MEGRRMTVEEQEQHRRKLENQLDEALADSFPASDPVSIVTSQEEEDWGEPVASTEEASRREGTQSGSDQEPRERSTPT
jgi:hypothetical protein